MLDANIAGQLKGYLQNIKRPIELIAALDDSAKATEMRDLLQEIADMSADISFIDDADSDSRKPSFQIKQPDGQEKIRFAGIPMGHEFTSLVLALLHVGGHPTKLDQEVIDQIKGLEGEYHFETYISLSCQNCPEVVQALNVMAVHNPNISHTMIDGALYQEEVDQRKIMAVPTVYLNGENFGSGRMSLPEIIAKLDKGAVKREAEKISAKQDFDVLIVGGGPAGASASIYAARKGIRTGIVAERFGGQVMDTMAIENFISVKETEGPKLVAALEEHVKEYEVDVMNLQRAKGLKKNGKMIDVELESGATLSSKAVILATGARWRELGVPGEKEYRGHGVAYCPHCDGPLFKGKPVAVIGGGNSGVEAAIDLAGIVGHVTLLEFNGELRADAVLQKKLFSLDNVEVITGAQTTEITGDDGKVNGLVYIDRATEQKHTVQLNAVFVQIGLIPNTDWLKGTIELSKFGEIEIDNHGQTSLPGVFAAGDVTTIPYKQIIMAMGDGARAALGAFDYLIRNDFDDKSEAA
ncbi:alkyl hydroperoxide reductase subunit F [Methylophaga thalassica]|uniref:Alkyl hydroperoxide reductase subunit F n=1 Tax=Methylophaga aminisulfidivorans MP TaxID=1026882 RepID=F5SVS6_9GAMM|nr:MULTISPECIES: alkyl hydroperoxide reductase subunit F [Methylophaga]EGL55654.1 alkyl hydroperoxide reductase, large subunit [Methylophaga aminisulfidivorans MP]WVI86484.1 alkyl hydroperoxide reductase subunit F [Methylophaga thalassica]